MNVNRQPLRANLHWVARSSRARLFVCFIASRSCRSEPCPSAELPDATKQTKKRARLLLATPQCGLAFTMACAFAHASHENIWHETWLLFSLKNTNEIVLVWHGTISLYNYESSVFRTVTFLICSQRWCRRRGRRVCKHTLKSFD